MEYRHFCCGHFHGGYIASRLFTSFLCLTTRQTLLLNHDMLCLGILISMRLAILPTPELSRTTTSTTLRNYIRRRGQLIKAYLSIYPPLKLEESPLWLPSHISSSYMRAPRPNQSTAHPEATNQHLISKFQLPKFHRPPPIAQRQMGEVRPPTPEHPGQEQLAGLTLPRGRRFKPARWEKPLREPKKIACWAVS